MAAVFALMVQAAPAMGETYVLALILEPSVTVNASGYIDESTAQSVNVSGTADALVGLPSPASAFELAVAEVNSRRDILPNDTLVVRASSSMYSPNIARQAAFTAIQSVPKPVALLGTWFLETTAAVASIASLEPGTPHITTAATADELSPEAYPMFVRATVSDHASARALMALCKAFDWTRVAVLHSTSGGGTALRVRTEALGVAHGVEVGGFSYPSDPDPAVRAAGISAMLARLKKSSFRIVVLALDASNYLQVFTHWYISNMAAEGYTLIGTELWTPDIVTLYPDLDPVSRQAAGAIVKGMLYLATASPNMDATPEAARYRTLSEEFYAEQNKTATAAVLRTMSPTARRSWDAVFLVARAIASLKNRGANPRNGTALRDEVLRTSFTGASGHVRFDPARAELDVSWELLSWHVNGSQTLDTTRRVGLYNASTGNISLIAPITWFDGTENVPADRIAAVHVPTERAQLAGAKPELRFTENWIQLASAILGGVGALAIVAHAVGLFVYRNTPIFRAGSATLLWLVLLGALLGMVSMVVVALDYNPDGPFGLQRDAIDTLCAVQPFVVGSAFTLVFGVLFATAHRISAIFNGAKTMKTSGVVISDKALLWAVMGIVAADQLINVAWFIADKPRLSMVRVSDTIGYNSCTESASSAWFLVSIVYKAGLLLLTLHKAFLTRNVPAVFNSSFVVAWATYNVTVVTVVVVPLSIVAAENVAFAQPFRVLALFFCSISIMALLIGRKIYIAIFRPDLNEVGGATVTVSVGAASSRRSRPYSRGNAAERDSSGAQSSVELDRTQSFEMARGSSNQGTATGNGLR